MKAYIYPTYNPSRDKSGNLYIKYFRDSFSDMERSGVKVVNRLWKIGISSMAFNLDADVFIIHWVDTIPNRRLGKAQFVFFLLLTGVISLLRKKIVWVLHNKSAHSGDSRIVDAGMKFMARHATCVITHSEEGVSFFDSRYPKQKGKCHYVPHPVYTSEIYPSKKLEYDYIIWGTVAKRKNVLEFVRFAVSSGIMNGKRILIVGHCSDKEYGRKINEAISGSSIEFKNHFCTDEELKDWMCRSRAVLFTYSGKTVLSSGALIYSLNFCKPIIGPNVGSFADLKGIVTVYDDFAEIPKLNVTFSQKACMQYINENTWDLLPEKLMGIINRC